MNWDAIGSIGTAVAVLVAAWQLRRNTQQTTTNFEDDLSREYRTLARAIPVSAHLGAVPTDDEFRVLYPVLFQYIDLSNEQVFLRQTARVSRTTWLQWRDGIKANLSQPAFERAWREVKATAGKRFSELRTLEASGFLDDPRRWSSRTVRIRQLWSG